MSEDQFSDDGLLSGKVRLRQAKSGYRAGMDAALLAAACDIDAGGAVLEVGCGAGAALISAAVRRPAARFTGIERDPAAAALARQNLALNGLEARVAVIEADVGEGFAGLGLGPFDAILCNPPYFDDAGALRGPAPSRRGAHLTDDGLSPWAEFWLKAAQEGGTITVIHRADRLADLLALLSPKAGSIRIRPVHPFADQPAKRVLIRAVKSGKAPLTLLPPLVMHDRSGAKHTIQAEAILRGDAMLGWG